MKPAYLLRYLSLFYHIVIAEEYRQIMGKMDTPAVEEPKKSAKGKSTQPKPAFVLGVQACANVFKSKFADMSGGFRSLSELGFSFKKAKKN